MKRALIVVILLAISVPVVILLTHNSSQLSPEFESGFVDGHAGSTQK